jgi:hypothetical protein
MAGADACSAIPVQLFGNSRTDLIRPRAPNNMGDVALSVSRDKLALSMSQVSGSIWVLNDIDQ